MNYVAYHSQDVMGSELGDGPPFGMLSRKPVKHLAGNTVWVIESLGKKKQYFIRHRFHVDDVEEIDDDYFRFQYFGETGDNFSPGIPISSEAWFKDFLKAVANFSIGVTPLKPEYLSRFEELAKTQTTLATGNKATDDWSLTEGEIKTSIRSYRSRSSAARDACIAEFGSACRACGFDFGTIYGSECDGFIEVHHREMVSTKDGPYVVDPKMDLIPLCPNCHRALHILRIEVEQLTDLIRERKP